MYMILASQFENLVHPVHHPALHPALRPLRAAVDLAHGEHLEPVFGARILVLFGVVKKNAILPRSTT